MSDFERTLARISSARADGYGIVVRKREGPGEGWVTASSLGRDRDLLDTTIASVRGMYGSIDRYIQAEWLLESLARSIADLGGSFALAAGALPELDPDRVLVAIEGGLVRGTALTSDRLAGADLPGLADVFRQGFTDLLAPVIAAIDSRGLRPAKTLWRSAADRLAQALVWAGRALDRPDQARELTRLTVGPESPDRRLRIAIKRAEDEYGGEYHLRNTCCLAYRTEGGELCQSCPLQRTGRNHPG